MAILNDKDLLPTSAQDAIRKWDLRYEKEVSKQPPSWAERYGDKFNTDSPMLRFPMSMMTSKYTEYKGDIRTKTLGDQYVDMFTAEYQNGFEVDVVDLLKNPVRARQWSRVPKSFVNAEKRHTNSLVAQAINAGLTSGNGWDSLFFFSAAHLANPQDPGLGTWSNYQSGALNVVSIANITTEAGLMQASVKDEHGEIMEVEPDVLFVPAAKGFGVKTLLGQENLATGETNPLFGKFTVVTIPQLDALDANDWYIGDSRLLEELPPWAIVEYIPPGPLGDALRNRWFGPESDYFKNTARIKVSSHIHKAVSLIYPHGLRKVVGA